MIHKGKYYKDMLIDLGKWGRKSESWTSVTTSHPDIYGNKGTTRTKNKKLDIKASLKEYIKTGKIQYSLQIFFDHIVELQLREAIYEEDHGDLVEYEEYYNEPSKHPEYVKMTNHCKAVSFLTELSSIIVEEMDVDISPVKKQFTKIKRRLFRNENNLSKYSELVKLEIDDNVEYREGDIVSSGRKVNNILEKGKNNNYYIYLHTSMGVRRINLSDVKLYNGDTAGLYIV